MTNFEGIFYCNSPGYKGELSGINNFKNRFNNFPRYRLQTSCQCPDPLFYYTELTLGHKKSDFSLFQSIIRFRQFRKVDITNDRKIRRKLSRLSDALKML